jgi:hypothetical protein
MLAFGPILNPMSSFCPFRFILSLAELYHLLVLLGFVQIPAMLLHFSEIEMASNLIK